MQKVHEIGVCGGSMCLATVLNLFQQGTWSCLSLPVITAWSGACTIGKAGAGLQATHFLILEL